MILHGILMFLCLVAWAPYVFLLNVPIALWHARRYGLRVSLIRATLHCVLTNAICSFSKLRCMCS